MIIHKMLLSSVCYLRLSASCCKMASFKLWFSLLLAVFCLPFTIYPQDIPSPESFLGFNPTDDKTIADWRQITDYFAKLDEASDRVKVEEIGKTILGRSQIVAYISSAENIRNLDKYKKLSRMARGLESDMSGSLNLLEGKTIVAISCSIHSTEIVASQMSMNLAYMLASKETDKSNPSSILDNTILLLIPSANPDGIDLVADWYRKTLGTKYEGYPPPELYNHYDAGHDNNRDWFMMNLPETRNITKLFWQEWFPQIIFDVHQQGQTGARFTIPPFFDPPNPRISPIILRELGLLGYKIAADLQYAGQKGVVTNATYDTWWHGGFRSAPYYHNSIGILSEAASARLMSPAIISRSRLENQRPSRGMKSPLERLTNNPDPWEGGVWKPSDIALMEVVASKAILDMAARYRIRYLQMTRLLSEQNRKPKKGEPKAFIVYAGQSNEEVVSRFLEILMWQGMEVREMTRELEVALKKDEPNTFGEIPAGSFIVMVNQEQKPNVLSLFEKQVYPERINANGEAEAPYDVSGWTLPIQMNIQYATAWNIRDLPKYEKYLKRITDINHVRKILNLKPNTKPFDKLPNPLKSAPKIGLYKGWANSMDEGWTRLVLDNHQIKYTSLMDEDFRADKLNYDAIILPSIGEKMLVEGRDKRRYPKEYTGGLTKKGVKNLKRYVKNGGKVICFDDSCKMVIKQFKLPMKDVLKGKSRKEFHCPGSILNLEVDQQFSISKGFDKETPAYFIYSSAYEISDKDKVKSIAKYAKKDILLSGWIFGEEHIKGKTAIAETSYGKGKLVLFGFRPQHRAQTYGTFPFIFNALEK